MKTQKEFLNLTDEEMVAQIVKTKNTVLFGYLYDRFSHLVYNKCHNFARSDDEAKDMAQDIFLKLYIKLDSFKGNSKFSTWLYAFAYNHCVNYVTRDKERKIEKHSIRIEEYDHLLIETDDYNLFQLHVEKLRKALEIIPPEDKMLLLLKYQDDLSIKDIMEVLKIGESAIKMRLKRAKARVVELCNEKL